MGDRYLHDYIFMAPPEGGEPVKVSTETEEIVKRMNSGWVQVDPPASNNKES